MDNIQKLSQQEINTELMFISMPIHFDWTGIESSEEKLNILNHFTVNNYLPLVSNNTIIGVINQMKINESDYSIKAYGFLWVDLGVDVIFDIDINNYKIDNINIKPIPHLSKELLGVMKGIQDITKKLDALDTKYNLKELQEVIRVMTSNNTQLTEKEIKDFIKNKKEEENITDNTNQDQKIIETDE